MALRRACSRFDAKGHARSESYNELFERARTRDDLWLEYDCLDSSAQEHLEEAVATARASLEEASKDGPRSTWAYLESKLGDSLETIGEREAANNKYEATDHLKEAVEADRAALQVMTMLNDPENWADTENTLGDASLVSNSLETLILRSSRENATNPRSGPEPFGEPEPRSDFDLRPNYFAAFVF